MIAVVWVLLVVGVCWSIMRVEWFVVFVGVRERVVGLVRLCFERRRAALESGSQVVLYESCVTEFSFAVR
jgi:hypothetical protein